MFHVILFEPEIPPNTGNIIRLAANTGCQLHLIEPMGFGLEDKLLRRAGLDYHEWANVKTYPSFTDLKNRLKYNNLYAFSTKGSSLYSGVGYSPGDALMFGPETRGLPTEILDEVGDKSVLRLPMQAESRSLNLSNSVSIAVYEAWRQNGFQSGN